MGRLNVGPLQLTYEVFENRAEMQPRQQRPRRQGPEPAPGGPGLCREPAFLALALMVSGLLIRFLERKGSPSLTYTEVLRVAKDPGHRKAEGDAAPPTIQD